MKRAFKLYEADIKAAIITWVVNEAQIRDSQGFEITLKVIKGPGESEIITAEVTER